MRRTSRDEQIDGHKRAAAVVDLGIVHVGAATDGARAYRDDKLRGRDRIARWDRRLVLVVSLSYNYATGTY